jgi:hypothetical protein
MGHPKTPFHRTQITDNQLASFNEEKSAEDRKKDFPTKSFCVDFYTPGNDELIDYQITFYQVVR